MSHLNAVNNQIGAGVDSNVGSQIAKFLNPAPLAKPMTMEERIQYCNRTYVRVSGNNSVPAVENLCTNRNWLQLKFDYIKRLSQSNGRLKATMLAFGLA